MDILIPILTLIVGFLLNNRLEAIKVNKAKEKSWQECWASKFISIAFDYNTTISEVVTCLFQLKQLSDETDLKHQESSLREKLFKIQYFGWEIQNFAQFAPQNVEILLGVEKRLVNLLSNLINEKKGDLEEIRKVQFEFNKAIKSVHAEMLISVNRPNL